MELGKYVINGPATVDVYAPFSGWLPLAEERIGWVAMRSLETGDCQSGGESFCFCRTCSYFDVLT